MTTNFREWINHPELLNRDTLYELRNLIARYPYFQTARLLYLKNLYCLHDATFGEELRKAALYITDRRILFYLIEGDKFAIHPQPKSKQTTLEEEPSLDRTLHLIDAFLSTVPEEKLQVSTEKNLSSDYMAYMLREEELPEQEETEKAVPLRGQSLIDEFIEKADEGFSMRITANGNEDEEPVFNPEEDEEESSISTSEKETEDSDDEDEESYFTETLAKIYIKQQRYSKALEIIKKLSLKYPKKNAYFADQIRFLEKLIINTKSK